MTQLHTLTITSAAARIRELELSPTSLLRACSDRIAELDPKLQAWVTIDYEGALLAAANAEKEIKEGHYRGPLHGIPVGIKDIFFTEGIATGMGSSIYSDYVPTYDATTIRLLKQAGAIIIGKTHTTEFAALAPSPTRNPWNLRYTPGGSSSGSAAAVSGQMCFGALGSQTYGSTLRPASYCGCVGFKPTFGRISTYGVYPLAGSLDHVGLFSRSVADSALLLQVLAGEDAGDPTSSTQEVPDYSRALHNLRPPKLGILREFFVENASLETQKNFQATIDRLKQAGANLIDLSLPASFERAPQAHFDMMFVESAFSHRKNYELHKQEYSPQMQNLIESGRKITAVEYLATQHHQQLFRQEMNTLCNSVDALITPATPAPAPKGFATTGDPSFNGPATFSGLPSLGLPSGVSESGLPFGLQLMAGTFAEPQLLRVGAWCEDVLAFSGAPAFLYTRDG